jgi:hypothetical protein
MAGINDRAGRCGSLVPRQFALAPVRYFRVGSNTFHVPVKRPHDVDSWQHRWAAFLSDQDQRFYRRLPFRRSVRN